MDPYGGGWPASPLRAGGGGNAGGGGGGMYDNISNDGIPMDALAELQDTAFEPQTRARSNTWPLPRPENFVEPETEPDSNKCSNQQLANTDAILVWVLDLLVAMGHSDGLSSRPDRNDLECKCSATSSVNLFSGYYLFAHAVTAVNLPANILSHNTFAELQVHTHRCGELRSATR
uniref:Uncharacterized protein n=1 Tax=Anopheles culicifacies TaxID=139723 RepID=A0A182MQT7_9DIPT